MDYRRFIIQQIEKGVSPAEIKYNLTEYGISYNDASKLVDQIVSEKPQKNLKINSRVVVIVSISLVLITTFLIHNFYFPLFFSQTQVGMILVSPDIILEQMKTTGENCQFFSRDENNFNLWCNGRPFFVLYNGTDVTYDMNGWSFLKEDASALSDLNDCDFYDSKKINENNYNLIFYCPKNIDSQNIIYKEYSYDKTSLRLEKNTQGDFSEMIQGKVVEKYPLLSSCSFVNSKIGTEFPEKPFLFKYICNESETLITVLPDYQYITPPFFNISDMTDSAKITYSFERTFGESCAITSIENNVLYAKCGEFSATLAYLFDRFYMINYNYVVTNSSEETDIAFIENYGSNFLLYAAYEKPIFLNRFSKDRLRNDFLQYDIGGKVLTLIKSTDRIDGLIRESEKIW